MESTIPPELTGPSHGPLVRDYMTPNPLVLGVGSSLEKAFRLMQENDIRHLPIVGSGGRLVGLLSDRELSLAKRERGIDPADVLVDELMSKDPFTVTPTTRLEGAAGVMANQKYGCAVVMDGERVAGILTTIDVLRALVELRMGAERGHAAP
ncbi:MAG: CBS domain-containing protein [Myxococcota bacterium]|nr:CBS domain-containing protein [Myxococcota bacterium]